MAVRAKFEEVQELPRPTSLMHANARMEFMNAALIPCEDYVGAFARLNDPVRIPSSRTTSRCISSAFCTVCIISQQFAAVCPHKVSSLLVVVPAVWPSFYLRLRRQSPLGYVAEYQCANVLSEPAACALCASDLILGEPHVVATVDASR
jgi:hypothetical protein